MQQNFYEVLRKFLLFCESEKIKSLMGNTRYDRIKSRNQKDFKCTDENGVIFGVEVQKRDNDNHQKRARYNLANLDTTESEKSVTFDELKDIYEICISKFDMFCRNTTIYHIDRIVRETQEVYYKIISVVEIRKRNSNICNKLYNQIIDKCKKEAILYERL